jgi:hypothetical protein
MSIPVIYQLSNEKHHKLFRKKFKNPLLYEILVVPHLVKHILSCAENIPLADYFVDKTRPRSVDDYRYIGVPVHCAKAALRSCKLSEKGKSMISALKRAINPYVVFLGICCVYLLFPSYNFDVDSVHYTLTSFLSATNFKLLFADTATPVHLAWHVSHTLLLKLLAPANLLESLYYFRIVNILLTLLHIFLFLKFIRLYAGKLTTSLAILVLSFSNVWLLYFLSLEVYTLNVLALLLNFYWIYLLTTQQIRANYRNILVLSGFSFLAFLCHIENGLLIAIIAVFLLISGFPNRFKLTLAYSVSWALCFMLFMLLIAHIIERDIIASIQYVFNYTNAIPVHTSQHFLANIVTSFKMIPEVFFYKYSVLFLVWVVGLVAFVKIAITSIRLDNFVKFLSLYILINGVFMTQWDIPSLEHKILFLPAALLLFSYLVAHAPQPISIRWKAMCAVLVLLLVVVNFSTHILFHAKLENQGFYRLLTTIRQQTTAPKVVVIDLPAPSSLKLYSLIFFNQAVEILDSRSEDFQSRLASYKKDRYTILRWTQNRFETVSDV